MLSRRQIIEWAIRLSVALVLCSITARPMHAAETELDAEIARRFQQQVAPILERHCFACHGDGANEGQVALDDFAAIEPTLRPLLWSRVLKNVRAGIMPPAGEERLSPRRAESSASRPSPQNGSSMRSGQPIASYVVSRNWLRRTSRSTCPAST
ncbi:MAG: hypothetical protein IT422_18930 [Pirellulaceae bacterium]|nr:hypothetical protein [Pirellulaceae bacterium]